MIGIGLDESDNLLEGIFPYRLAAKLVVADNNQSAPASGKRHVETRLLAQEAELALRIRSGHAVYADLSFAALKGIYRAARDSQTHPFMKTVPDDVLERLHLCYVAGDQRHVIDRTSFTRDEVNLRQRVANDPTLSVVAEAFSLTQLASIR